MVQQHLGDVRAADRPFPGRGEHFFDGDGQPHAPQPLHHLVRAPDPPSPLLSQPLLERRVVDVDEQPQHVHVHLA